LVTVIGAAALFIVLSGFAGLKDFSLTFSQSFDPDLKALPSQGKFIEFHPVHEKQLAQIAGIANFSKELEEGVYFTFDEKGHPGYIKGVDSLFAPVVGVDTLVDYGQFKVKGGFGVLGWRIGMALGATIDNYRNPLTVLAPKPGKGSLSQGPKKPYNEQDIVLSGMYSVEQTLDYKYLIVDLPLAQALLEKEPYEVSGINFKLVPGADEAVVKEKIAQVFDGTVQVKNRQELNGTLHRMLNTENMATYLIFTLVLIIALFNVVGAVIMMILDQLSGIKTLYNLGTTIKKLRRIYFYQGFLTTTLGGLVGILIGALLIWSQILLGWLKISDVLAYPVAFKLGNVFLVLATIMVLGFIAAIIASSRINKRLLQS
jgi:lipoprotein-releasing system permease protein